MNNSKIPKIVTLGILTVITVVFWVGFGIYRIFTQKPEDTPGLELVQPINPSLDLATLSSLSRKKYLTESQIGETILVPINQEEEITLPIEEESLFPEETLLIDEEEATPTATASAEATESANALP